MADKKTDVKSDRIEREYVIPLRPEWRKVSRYKRTNKAVKAIKEFLARHMKIRDKDLNKIKVDKFLNEILWSRGIKNPPSKIKVKAVKEDGIVRAEAVEMPERLKFKKARFDKREKKAMEIAQSKKSTMEKMKEAVSGATSGKKQDSKTETAQASENPETEKEKEEKKAAVVEAEEKIEKQISKAEKKTTQQKTQKQAKGQRTGYNSTSRGK